MCLMLDARPNTQTDTHTTLDTVMYFYPANITRHGRALYAILHHPEHAHTHTNTCTKKGKTRAKQKKKREKQSMCACRGTSRPAAWSVEWWDIANTVGKSPPTRRVRYVHIVKEYACFVFLASV